MRKLISCLALIILISSSFAAETGSKCKVDSQCPELHDCINDVCVHKDLFPITFREVMGTIWILIMNALMTAGGVGAGSAYVPYIRVIFQMSLKLAINTAYTCVFGGGLGNLANIIWMKNPKNNRYMINYNINMIILPALMIGVLIGMILNRIFPPFITNLILLIVLGFSIYKNYTKLRLNMEKERVQRELKNQPLPTEEAVQLTVIQKTETDTPQNNEVTKNTEVEKKEAKSEDENQAQLATLEKENEKEETQQKNDKELAKVSNETDPRIAKRELLYKKEQEFPFYKLRELLINVVIIVVIGLIRGTQKFDPVVGVDWTCGWDFLWFSIAIFAYGLTLSRNIYLIHKWQKVKVEVGYVFLPEDPLITRGHIIKLTLGSIAAGIIGAIVALGGALILGPVLLDMGIPPAFAGSTTGVFMIFSMFNAMFQTILNGLLKVEELAWYICLGFVFSFTSSKIANWYVKKTGRGSTLILLIMIAATLGFLCLLAIFIKSIIDDFEKEIKFTPVC